MADMRNHRMNGNRYSNVSRFDRSCNNEEKIQCPSNCHSLKSKLQTVDFAIVDTVLYLDAYPRNAQALEYYHKLVSEREALVKAINEKCGPICIRDNKSRTEWNWVEGPWPWEPEAN